MEEVDGIVVHTLRTIGCDIDDDVVALRQFSTEMVVEATARCLHVIDASIDVQYRLPPSMAARFRIGTALATAIQSIGYQGDIGYHTFLYSNETELRRVLLFLIERLPKESTEASEQPLGAAAQLHKALSTELSRQLTSPWVPPFCSAFGLATAHKLAGKQDISEAHSMKTCRLSLPSGQTDVTKPLSKDVQSYYRSGLPYVRSQPPSQEDLAASVLEDCTLRCTEQSEWETEWSQQGLASRLTQQEYNSKKRDRVRQRIADLIRQQSTQLSARLDVGRLGGVTAGVMVKGSRFTHAEKLQFAQDDDKMAALCGVTTENSRVNTELELQQQREAELSSLTDKLTGAVSSVENAEVDMKTYSVGMQQMKEQLSNVQRKNVERREVCRVKRKTLDLLPDADNNIAKLQLMVDTSSKRLINLAAQWEKHRVPLIDEYRQLKDQSQDYMSDMQCKVEQIREMQERMRELAVDARDKDELCKQLVAEYERMAKDVKRSAYTQRIMEIVANIKKQNQDIDKVLIDTKAIQKEINQLSGKLDRTFTVTDELIFKDAKKDEAVRKSYKYLAALHENCSLLIKTVEETGQIMREIRDLEDQLDQDARAKLDSNLEKITSDLMQMRKENAALLDRLRQSQSGS